MKVVGVEGALDVIRRKDSLGKIKLDDKVADCQNIKIQLRQGSSSFGNFDDLEAIISDGGKVPPIPGVPI